MSEKSIFENVTKVSVPNPSNKNGNRLHYLVDLYNKNIYIPFFAGQEEKLKDKGIPESAFIYDSKDNNPHLSLLDFYMLPDFDNESVEEKMDGYRNNAKYVLDYMFKKINNSSLDADVKKESSRLIREFYEGVDGE